MSYVPVDRLRGLADPTLSFSTIVVPFTTAPITIDSKTQYQAYIKAFRIVNQDGANVVQFVQGALDQPTKTVPINSEFIAVGWESLVQITPNAVTGTGYIELDIVPLPYAMRM